VVALTTRADDVAAGRPSVLCPDQGDLVEGLPELHPSRPPALIELRRKASSVDSISVTRSFLMNRNASSPAIERLP